MNLRKFAPYFFVLPTLLVVATVLVYPVAQSFIYSFYVFSLTGAPQGFVGLANYIRLFSDPDFIDSVKTTLYFMTVSIIIQTVMALIIALALNEKIRFEGFFRSAILIVPWAVTPIVNGLMWQWIFNPTYGLFNGALYQLGLIKEYLPFFIDPTLTIHAAIVADVWGGTPFMALMFFAAIQGVPSELYDAAKVDGSSALDRFLHITLPTIRPTAAIIFVVKLVWAFRVFDIILGMTEGGPGNATRVIAFYTWENLFKYSNFSYGATLSWAIAIISTILAIIYLRLLYKEA